MTVNLRMHMDEGGVKAFIKVMNLGQLALSRIYTRPTRADRERALDALLVDQ